MVNIRSLTLAALREAGIAVMAGRSREPLSPAWAVLKAKLEGRRLRYGLCRFISFCSGQNIAPEQVDHTTFARFEAALAAQSFVKVPAEIYRNACLFWNRASRAVPGWPNVIIEIPVRGRRYTVDWRKLPEAFRADAEAYLNPDILAADYVRSASPRTVDLRRHQIKVLATAVIRAGVPADRMTGLAILVKPENAWQAMRFFLDRAGGKKTTANHELARLLGAIGRHRVKLPEADQRSLDDLSLRLAVSPTGMTGKNRARLRQFDDPANIDALLNLPADIVRQVRKATSGACATPRG